MLINAMNNKNNVHRSYKKILGVSVACLSLFATISLSGNVSHAATNLKPEIVQAIEQIPEPVVVEEQAPASHVEILKQESVKYVGVPYVYGGTTPNGFDCSGFTQHVFKSAGINLPRVSRDQANIDRSSAFAGKTTTVTNVNDVQAGDLVFFSNTPGRVSHVGIALEDNKYVHASTSRRAITIANRSGSWYNGKFTKAIRINQ